MKIENLTDKYFNYCNQFRIIAPYKKADQLVVFPHSGYSMFFSNEQKDIWDKSVKDEFKSNGNGLPANIFKFLQEADGGFEHSVLPFLLSGEKILEKKILPEGTWALVNLANRITGGDVNRGCMESQKVIPSTTFTGMELFPDEDNRDKYAKWVIDNHVRGFQRVLLEILSSFPEITTVLHMHTYDPVSGFSNIKTVSDDDVRPMAEIFKEMTVYPALHTEFFPDKSHLEPFDINLLPNKIIKKGKAILEESLSFFKLGRNSSVSIDKPYCLKEYRGVNLASLVAMQNKDINQVLIEANKAVVESHREAGLAYLESVFKIAELVK